MFCDTTDGANASATIYSLIITAKKNGLDPFSYFEISSLEFLVAKLLSHFFPGTGNQPKPNPDSEQSIRFKIAKRPVFYGALTLFCRRRRF